MYSIKNDIYTMKFLNKYIEIITLDAKKVEMHR